MSRNKTKRISIDFIIMNQEAFNIRVVEIRGNFADCFHFNKVDIYENPFTLVICFAFVLRCKNVITVKWINLIFKVRTRCCFFAFV